MRRQLAIVTALVGALAGTAHADWRDGQFGIGLRTSTENVGSANQQESNTLHMAGGGIQVRYRASARWSIELSTETMRSPTINKDAPDGMTHYVREAKATTFDAFWHISPHRRWDWYLIVGLGGTNDAVTYDKVDGTKANATFHETHVHFGLGLEHACGHFGFGAELRMVGLSQKDDGKADAQGGLVPMNSSGAMFNLTATYYF